MSENSEITEESAPLEIGKYLVQAREQHRLSQEQMAKRLNLTVQKLDDLEHDRLEKLGPPIFVKGYVKAYCKVVGLDHKELLEGYDPQDDSEQIAAMQSFSRRTEKEAHDNRLMLVSYIILAIILGSSAIWWWQNSDDPLSLSTPESSTVSSSPISSEGPESAKQQPVQPGGEIQEQSQQTPAPEAQQSATTLSAQEPISNTATEEREETADAAPTANTAVQSEPLKSGQQRVYMRFSGECWVAVEDADGKRLVYDIKNAGQELELIGKAPFAVTLGKHDVVDIELNGEAVDISQFPKNRLAKFSLPLTE
ncbi:DUF4115 domain-containing protein [Pseudoalteromonas sp. MM17-2]|uniref:RodZ domain-containing protein n=1 Tax=Pseudoalteromonas sp. MM17-2 TaxID=2917753 RepID=UPI001EF541E0|nr:RodZ domain-containing protein [Pseudoalteromonas sp. MM17-2]MCG7543580.1 DUF4115 domain-containing protein [Pseudoalteromonas sp. MM17-2]